MSVCKVCGKELQSGVTFCASCGAYQSALPAKGLARTAIVTVAIITLAVTTMVGILLAIVVFGILRACTGH